MMKNKMIRMIIVIITIMIMIIMASKDASGVKTTTFTTTMMMIMMMMMTTTTTTSTTTMALKGAVRDFVQSPTSLTVSNTQASRAQSCANHAHHTRRSYRIRHVVSPILPRAAQLLSLAQLKSHFCHLYLTG